MTFRLRHARQRLALFVGSKLGPAPHPFQKLSRRGRRLRHRVVDLVIGVSLETEELREFASQCENFLNKRAIVRSRFFAARDVGFVGLLPEIAAFRKLKEGLDAGARQGDDIFARKAAIARGLRRRLPDKLGEALQVFSGLQHELEGLFRRKDILRKRRMKFSETGSDFRHARFSGFIEERARADKPPVIFLEETPLLGREAQRIGRLVERLDPRKKLRVGQDGHAMLAQHGRDLALDFLPLVIRVGGGKIEENRADFLKAAAGSFQRLDGVREAWRLGVAGDLLHLGQMKPHRFLEGRHEIPVANRGEGRHLKRRFPVLKQDRFGGHTQSFRGMRSGFRRKPDRPQ